MHDLAVHQITMTKGGPAGLVQFAAKAGLKKICLFTTAPKTEAGEDIFPIVTAEDRQEFQTLLADHDVTIINAEYFPVMPGIDVTQYAAALELAAALGAKRAVTHIHETDPTRITDQLGTLCEMTRKLGLESDWNLPALPKAVTALKKL